MSKLITLLSIAAALLLIAVSCRSAKSHKGVYTAPPSPTATGKIVLIEYLEQGTMAQPNEHYLLILLDNGQVDIERQRGMNTERFTTNGDIMDQITEIARECDLKNWEDHYSPAMQVYDGYSWRFNVKYDNGQTKSSGGNNARPSNGGLRKFSEAVWNIKKQ